jgi:hypothetical protein
MAFQRGQTLIRVRVMLPTLRWVEDSAKEWWALEPRKWYKSVLGLDS